MASGKRRICADDLWALKRVGTPSLSPDGRHVAVEVASYDLADNGSTSSIWILATSGEEPPRRLTTARAKDKQPLWSPDGSLICFSSKREGDDVSQLYLISPNGGEASRLTDIPSGAASAKWFAEGKQLAFISWVWPDITDEKEQAARLAERKESKVKAYAAESTCVRFWDHWLADGRVPHLFVVNVETGIRRDVMARTGLSLLWYENSPELSSSIYDVSPDGAEVAIEVDSSEDPGRDIKADILTLPLDGGPWTNITAQNTGDSASPRYSPDGKWLAYSRQEIRLFYADRRRLALTDRGTGQHRVLTEAWDRSIDAPLWAPDSTRVYFLAEDKAKQPIWSLEIDGREPQIVAAGGAHLNYDVSRDGSTLAFVRTTMSTPPTAFAAAADGSAVRKVDTFNDELVASWDLGQVEEVIYDGWGDEPVQMWITYPPDFDTGKKWPLLQNIHGGPHAAWLDVFHFRWNAHVFASQGYIVVGVNYHGSSGWGQSYTDSITGKHGEKEFDDIERSTDHLLAAGYVDPDRLVAAGGSYGGYLVAWMNGHTDRYKAYVCHAGVYNLVSQMASDVVVGRDRELGGFPWEAPEKVASQSAHSYAERFASPTLVIHGELDYRVPVTQALEYFATLRMRGVPARLLYYPDENHWILKPQNSQLWYREFFAWLDRYAPGGAR